jgi:hypothetical protein
LINTEFNKRQIKIIEERLTDILNELEKGNYSLLKVLNVYDLFSIILSSKFEDENYKKIIEVLEKILYHWITHSEYANITNKGEKLIVVQDLSGSMHGKDTLLKSAILLTLVLIRNPSTKIVVFDEKFNDETTYFNQCKEYRKKPLKMAYEIFRCLEKLGDEKYFEGTALRDAIKWTINNFNKIDKMIIISDEVSWEDEISLHEFSRELKKIPKVIFYNPERNSNDVQVVKNIVRIAGLSTQIFNTLYILNNLNNLVKEKYKMLDELSKNERSNRIQKKLLSQ